MSHAEVSPLRKVSLRAARSPAFPDGSIRHGYDFVAPLDSTGHIDVEAWKAHRGLCVVHRIWGDDAPMRGQLVHRAGGAGGATWAFVYGSATDAEEEAGFHFADHAFQAGEYVSVREVDGDVVTFRVTAVANA
jgi:hypothetical protein